MTSSPTIENRKENLAEYIYTDPDNLAFVYGSSPRSEASSLRRKVEKSMLIIDWPSATRCAATLIAHIARCATGIREVYARPARVDVDNSRRAYIHSLPRVSYTTHSTFSRPAATNASNPRGRNNLYPIIIVTDFYAPFDFIVIYDRILGGEREANDEISFWFIELGLHILRHPRGLLCCSFGLGNSYKKKKPTFSHISSVKCDLTFISAIELKVIFVTLQWEISTQYALNIK